LTIVEKIIEYRHFLRGRKETMKTYSAKEIDLEKQWFVIDADGKVLGRMATRIADVLRGKNKPIFTPHVDTGDFVVVVNAEKVKLTGNKLTDKIYYRHSGYPGGLKSASARKLMEKKPEEIIRTAVKGMLPKNKLASRLLKKLKVYKGPEHPHEAQEPRALKI
jgi:large subunit ribosomal protein L13